MAEATNFASRGAVHCDLPIPVNIDSLPVAVYPCEPPIAIESIPGPPGVVDEKEAFHHQRDLKEVVVPFDGQASSTPAHSISGLRRRTFYITPLAVILLVAAIAGGTAGGIVAKKNNGTDSHPSSSTQTASAKSSPTATPSAPSLMHADSQIATANWTQGWTGKDIPKQSFFVYQDLQGAIIMATWDSQTTSWTSINVTDRLWKSRLSFRAKLGTPLAATAGIDSHVVLYFLQADNRIVEVHSNDETLEFWKLGDLYEADVKVEDDSRIAADGFMCMPDCAGSPDGQNNVRVFLSKDDQLQGYSLVPWTQSELEQRARHGSSVGAVPYVPPSGPMEMRVFFDTGSRLGMMTWKNDSGWDFDGAFSGKTHPTFAGQLIVATSFAASSTNMSPTWVIMALQFEKNGTLAATCWDPESWEWSFGKPVSLEGGPKDPAFSLIAVNNDRKFYGVIEGVVFEYRIDRDDPTRFVFTTKVPLGGIDGNDDDSD